MLAQGLSTEVPIRTIHGNKFVPPQEEFLQMFTRNLSRNYTWLKRCSFLLDLAPKKIMDSHTRIGFDPIGLTTSDENLSNQSNFAHAKKNCLDVEITESFIDSGPHSRPFNPDI
ncbi:hypothetical protein VNO78_05829 [Psophocarpus tetragonolobus]|uniref:Uncharacterized protein n=1 Tax=Psophocarpus tetragonolobus TaxID=3891 RepID=A0AAN9T0L4_PSOTE